MTTQQKNKQPPPKHQLLATYLFGGLLFCFMAAAYFLDFGEITPAKDRILGFVAASLGGFFGYFFAGSVGVSIVSAKSRIGSASVKATGAVALFVLVLFWWFQSASPMTRRGEFGLEFQRSVEMLEKQITRWSETMHSMTNFALAKPELVALMTSQSRSIKGALDEMMSQRGITKRETEKLRSIKESFERKEEPLLAQVDGSHVGNPQQPISSETTNDASAKSAATQGIEGIPLIDYLRSNLQHTDVSLLGFSQKATNSVRLVNAARYFGRPAANLFYVSEVIDWSTYENPEYPGYRGPWTQGFVIIERLSPEQIYRPLSPTVMQEISAEFRKLAMSAPLLTNITFFTCSDIVNCDQFLAQITKVCAEAGFVVRVEPIREEPLFKSIQQPKSAVFRVVGGNYCYPFGEQINRAFFTAIEFPEFRNNMFIYGWRLPPNTLEITIAGFPKFDADGRATFDP